MRPYFVPSALGKQLHAQGRKFAKGPPYGTWYLRYRNADGRPVREASKCLSYDDALFENLRLAREEEAIRKGWAPRRVRLVHWTWEELATRYVAAHKHLTNQSALQSVFKIWLTPHFTGRTVADVSPGDAQALIAKAQAAGLKPGSIHQIRKRGKQAWRYAVANKAAAHNPFETVTAPKIPKRKAPYLRREQVMALRLAAGADRLLLDTALFTGLRRCELAGLLWTDIAWDDGPHGTLLVRRSWDNATNKDAEERLVPLHPYLRDELLRARAQAKSPWVLPNRAGKMRSRGWAASEWLKALLARAGVERPPGLTFHSLRATFITHLIHGGNLVAAQRLAGHSTPAITEGTYGGHELGYLAASVGGLPYAPVAPQQQTDIQGTPPTPALSPGTADCVGQSGT